MHQQRKLSSFIPYNSAHLLLKETKKMNNFSFRNPTRIHFGKGQIAKIKEEIPADARVLITYGGGSIKKNGVLEQVYAALENIIFFEFGGIEPNPHFETLMKAVELVKQEKITYLLAVGGGSVVDGTKFIAGAALYDGDPLEMVYTRAAKVKAALPLGFHQCFKMRIRFDATKLKKNDVF
jgi:NADP-dependent alcohol dehydrogenase